MKHYESDGDPNKKREDLKELHLFDIENARFEQKVEASEIREILAIRAEALRCLREMQGENDGDL